MECWLKHIKGNTQPLIKRNVIFFTWFVKLLICADSAAAAAGWGVRGVGGRGGSIEEHWTHAQNEEVKLLLVIFDIQNHIFEHVINIKN